MEKIFESIWYSKFSLFSFALLPFSILFYVLIKVRLYLYDYDLLHKYTSGKPSIIVGNLTVGGSGKTPFVIWLAKYLSAMGLKVGVVSSGYKAMLKTPVLVNEKSNPNLVGDEAVLIAKQTNSEIVSCGNRVDATKLLLNKKAIDVIIHDDGLQHYKLARDYEIALINDHKLFGNSFLLPAGPLREPKSRLNNVDIVAYTNSTNDKKFSIRSVNKTVINLVTNQSKNLKDFSSQKIHLVSGIASLENITKALDLYMINYTIHKYDDHHAFDGSEVCFDDDHPIFITDKDYVKLIEIKNNSIWVLDHYVEPNKLFINKINKDLSVILNYEN